MSEKPTIVGVTGGAVGLSALALGRSEWLKNRTPLQHVPNPSHPQGLTQQSPQATATVCAGRRRTFLHPKGESNGFAAALKTLGVATGDSVGMLGQKLGSLSRILLGDLLGGCGGQSRQYAAGASRKSYIRSIDCDTRVLIVDDAFSPVYLGELAKGKTALADHHLRRVTG